MKQSKFSLADVLTVLTALAFGFICFLGENFYTLGNTSRSITWALLVALSLAATALTAKLLKQTSRNFKTSFILEMAVLLLFTVLTVFFAFSSFPHYFHVSAKKTEIQNELRASIVQAVNMFVKYEKYAEDRKVIYNAGLKTAVTTKSIDGKDYSKYGFVGGISDETQIKNKMFAIHADLYPTTYSDTTDNDGIKEIATSWLTKATSTTNSWKPIGVVDVVTGVENNSKGWLRELVEFSKIREKGETYNDFGYELSFNDVKTQFTTSGKPMPLSIGLAIAAYLLMLLSWFVTKRHSRSTGILTTASYEVVL